MQSYAQNTPKTVQNIILINSNTNSIALPDKKHNMPVVFTTPREKLKVRNYEIFMAYQTGITIPALMNKYKLSQRAIYKILSQRNDENAEWGTNLPTKTALAMHEIILHEAWVEIEELRTQRRAALKQGEINFAMGATDKIVGHIMKYDSLLVNGVTLGRIKGAAMEVKRVIDTGRSQ